MPAGLLFLLLATTPFSDNAKAAWSEEDGAPEEEALLSNMGGLMEFMCAFEDTVCALGEVHTHN